MNITKNKAASFALGVGIGLAILAAGKAAVAGEYEQRWGDTLTPTRTIPVGSSYMNYMFDDTDATACLGANDGLAGHMLHNGLTPWDSDEDVKNGRPVELTYALNDEGTYGETWFKFLDVEDNWCLAFISENVGDAS